jgi:BlaI family transcriptional regulator, penicillinase repressor
VEITKQAKSQLLREHVDLSRRERQILEVLYQKGGATGKEVHKSLADPPGHSAVRGTLRILETKGIVIHKEKGLRYVYFPLIQREKARRTLLQHLLHTYFDDSILDMMVTLLNVYRPKLTDPEISELAARLEIARDSRPKLVPSKPSHRAL